MWKNIVERGRPQMAIWRMRIAFWVPKATNTHAEYLILIAFPLQQWIRLSLSFFYEEMTEVQQSKKKQQMDALLMFVCLNGSITMCL